MVTAKEILKPTNSIIKKLGELEKKYRTEELKEEKHYYIKKIPIKTKKESNTPKLRSEEKLYLKKRSKRLSKLLPSDRLIVSESGLFNTEDLRSMAELDVRSFLIGESLMRQPDVKTATQKILSNPLRP